MLQAPPRSFQSGYVELLEKLKAFFDKYSSLGIDEFRAEEQEKLVLYDLEPSYPRVAEEFSYQRVAEESAPYGAKDN